MAANTEWFQDERQMDLIVILDDATSEIYYAQLVDQESTRTVMAAIRHVVETKGWFSSLYSDRASHFFRTPKAGEPVDTRQHTEVGRALKDVGIDPIPAYSPQARGRSERNCGTRQGRLPQAPRIRNIKTADEANHLLRSQYIAEFNKKFAVEAAQPGTAFMPVAHLNLDRIFSIHHERVVARDNTIQFANRVLQVPPTRLRVTLAGCRVLVYEHLDGTISIGYGPHTVARFTAAVESDGRTKRAVETAALVENRKKRGFPHDAWESRAHNARLSHSYNSPGGLNVKTLKKKQTRADK